MKKYHVAVIFGGCSSEYSVSLESAYSVIRFLDKDLFEPVMIGISRQGDWFYFQGDIGKIREDTWCNEEDCIPALLSPDRREHRLILSGKDGMRYVSIDAAFPVLHGKNGEDGTLQGLIGLAGIPLAGCGILASALCMDKDRAHKLVRAAGVRVPEAVVLTKGELECAGAAAVIPTRNEQERAGAAAVMPARNEQERAGAAAVMPTRNEQGRADAAAGGGTEKTGAVARNAGQTSAVADAAGRQKGALIEDSAEHTDMLTKDNMPSAPYAALEAFVKKTGYPLFVKPVKAGSSYGVTKVCRHEQLMDAVSLAFQYDDEVIVEEAIEGFEVGCAVLGTGALVTGEVDEIELAGGFFDFTEKYTLKTSAIHVPARISSQKAAEIKETAKLIYRTLGCSVFARVDMFLTPEGEIVFNEVNTIPGFTEHSRYPGMMKAAGFSFEEILTKIIALALENSADDRRAEEKAERNGQA